MISRNGVDERVTMTREQQEKAAAAPKAVAKILATRLGGQPEDYRKAVTATDAKGKLSRYSVVRHHVDSYTFDLIKKDMKQGGWYGVFSSNDPIRTYPSGQVASNVVGFVNAEGKGAGGFEYSITNSLLVCRVKSRMRPRPGAVFRWVLILWCLRSTAQVTL
ncbi:cell division protein FtsI [Cutibacterium acnes JCM 18916]|nr:cell division protein FtsI [Cutibacterium acnes JCM 18916]